jgi:hypothetical protein
MSERTQSPDEKPANPVPEKPAPAELSDKALETVSGGTGSSRIAHADLQITKVVDKASPL